MKGENIRPEPMLFIHSIDHNMINYDATFSRVYQEESKM